MNSITHISPKLAFAAAIAKGDLSDKPDADNYAGRFMFMFRSEHGLAFKNIETRQYVYSKARAS